VLGPDGAGKSSLVEGIRTTVPIPVRVVYMGLTGGALRYTERLRLPGLVLAASALVVWGRYLTGRYHTTLGRLVLFDRYVYDAVAPHPRRTRPWHRASRWTLARLCPGPDLVLVLNAPGAVMFVRKGAYSAEVLEDWRQRFLTLRERLPNVHVIDATQPAHAVRVEATRVIWRGLATRWRSLRITGSGR
jgi:thymidylate kinase